MMINVVFLVRSLNIGGAEKQLTILLKRMDRTRFKPSVLCFYGGGELESELEDAGVTVVELGKQSRWDLANFTIKLIKKLKEIHPDIVHGYLPVPNLILGFLKPFFPGVKIIFGIRATVKDFSQYDWTFGASLQLERLFSKFADCIIVNSVRGKQYYEQQRYPKEKIIVISNGIDTCTYYPKAEIGADFRGKWNIPTNDILVGVVGRLDPAKDLPLFLRAAAKVAQSSSKVRFISVGHGTENYRQELIRLSDSLGLSNRMLWIEEQKNMLAVYNALDICCSTSIGEGFSNAIAEAMACGVPCVVTDVGDSARIVGDTGEVIPAGESGALANALMQLIVLTQAERRQLSEKARQRIMTEFSVERMVNDTQSVFENLARRG